MTLFQALSHLIFPDLSEEELEQYYFIDSEGNKVPKYVIHDDVPFGPLRVEVNPDYIQQARDEWFEENKESIEKMKESYGSS